MEQMIIEFFKTYGWQLTLVALSGILLLGILKFFNVFEKIKKEYRKYFYGGISALFSITASAVYLICVDGFTWAMFGLMILPIYLLNQGAYALYETLGIRVVFHKFGNLIISLIAQKRIDEAILHDTLSIEEIETENKEIK